MISASQGQSEYRKLSAQQVPKGGHRCLGLTMREGQGGSAVRGSFRLIISHQSSSGCKAEAHCVGTAQIVRIQ